MNFQREKGDFSLLKPERCRGFQIDCLNPPSLGTDKNEEVKRFVMYLFLFIYFKLSNDFFQALTMDASWSV